MLQRQEEARNKEVKAREDKQLHFMSLMADTVIKEQDAKAQEEDLKIQRYQKQRELNEQREQERRARRLA